MFILITPVHNEISEIDALAGHVARSSFRPDLWVIVDDCSDDGSSEKLDELVLNHDFIKAVHINEKQKYMEFHISEVFQRGVQEAGNFIDHADYIGFLDADIRFAQDYWLRLRSELDQDQKLGIVSGALCSRQVNTTLKVEAFQRIDNPRGGLRLVRGVCFRQIGGVKRSRTWDAVMNVQARLQGWSTKLLPDLYALSTRPTDDRFGKKDGEFSRGKREWHLHQPLWQVLVRVTFKMLKGNFSGGIAYLRGFLHERRIGGEQFPDPGVRHYYRVERGKEWIRSIKARLFNLNDPHRIIPVRDIDLKDIYKNENGH